MAMLAEWQRSKLQNTPGLPFDQNLNVVDVLNTSQTDVGQFGVLGIDNVVVTPTAAEATFRAGPKLECSVPALDNHFGKFVVCMTPIAAGKFGKGVISGLTPCKVYINDEDHRCADISDGTVESLESRAIGAAQILWKEAGTGEKWAVVRLGAYSPPFGLVVASDAANYCWLDEEHPDDTNPGAFVIADGEYEKHALIHSDYLLGLNSIPIKQVILDLACTSSSWTRGLTCYAQGEPHEEIGQCFLDVSVAPVLVDFDPTDISWNDAYVTGGGLLTGNIGSWANYNHLEDYLVLEASPITGEPPESAAEVSISSKFPNLFAAKHSEVGPTYLQEDEIYGFVVTLGLSGQANQEAEWVGGVGETFVLLGV